MRKVIRLPHRVCEGTCYINGLEDVLSWKGAAYPDFLLSVTGGMASFAYLKFKMAKPPCMVYWGSSPKYFLRNLEKIVGFRQEILEGGVFRTAFARVKSLVDNGEPVMAGALDMYYLHYYPELYKKSHVPIHYVLVVGYDDDKQAVLVHDCSMSGMQAVPYPEFEKSLDVKVPGMSNRNTIRVFKLPKRLPSELDVAKKGFKFKADQMLNPPVSIFGILAMRKLAKEITSWRNRECFEHLATYATTPPQLPKTFENSDGMRLAQAHVLKTLGEKHGIGGWTDASSLFQESGKLIKGLSKASVEQDAEICSELLVQIAEIEEKAYLLLKNAY